MCPIFGVVTAHESPIGAATSLDRQRGRDDDAQRLRAHLADAPVEYLSGALENEHVGPDELKLILNNRFATSRIVTRIGKNREWMRTRDVKKAFVANPAAPVVLARQVLPFLFWGDLADVAANVRLSPTVRRDAEKVLRTRLGELSVGERSALARRPSRGIVAMLADDLDAGVLRALAGNPRTTESDVVRIATRPNAPAAILGWLADQSPWGRRREIMVALVRNAVTPRAAALRLTRHFSPGDLELLCREVSVPRLVRVACERRLAESASAEHAVDARVG